MAKQQNATKKTVISIVVLVVLLAVISGLVYCMITGTLAEALGVKTSDELVTSHALKDGMAVTFTGAENVSELYINTDKTVYAELAQELEGADKILLVFTDKEITADMTEQETSESIIMIAHFAKQENGYVILFESLIDDFGTGQDVILYDTASETFCTDTSITVNEKGKLTISESLNIEGVLYCYMPGTCGISADESVSADFLASIFATAQFEAHQ